MSDGGGFGSRADERLRSLGGLLEALRLPRELSPREAEVVAASMRGLETKAIAVELGLSPKTVDELWRRVYRKFGCRSRMQVLSRVFSSALGQVEAQPVSPLLVRLRAERRSKKR
jgi:DNA-binding NarL/FixJ family response regulator